MKKLIMLFACLGVFALTAQAQKCSKPCTKSKVCAKKGKTTVDAGAISIDDAQIAKLASLDETIERRQCAKSGTVSYFQKNTCAVSGKVSFQEVTYDAKTAKFVNVSPSGMGAAASDSANTMNKSGTVKKACCASGAEKACCASKKACSGKKGMTNKVKVSEVKKVSSESSSMN